MTDRKKKVLLVGAGRVGRFVAAHLQDVLLDVMDPSEEALANLRSQGLGRRLSSDASPTQVQQCIRAEAYDLVISAVPGNLGEAMAQAVLAAGASLVDVSFYPRNPVELAAEVRPDAVYIPDAGIAPGLSNLFAGKWHRAPGGLREFRCYVGGLPQRPRPPLFYEAPFHPMDALDEYVRPAGIIRNGRVEWPEPLAVLEHVSFFDEVGPLTAFYSDGLRTLLYTLKDVPMMAELTLRYRPHLELMRSFYELGFLHEDRRATLAEWLLPAVKMQGPDMTLMRCRAVGSNGAIRTFQMIDYGTPAQASMSKVTGSVAVVAARAVLNRRAELFGDGGFYPLERLSDLWDEAVAFLRAQGARIKETAGPA